MANPFDQFDQPSSNPFDKFDNQPIAPISRTERFGKGLRDPVDAGAQLLTHILPNSVVDAGNKFNNWVAEKTGLVGKLPDGGVDQQIKEAEREYQQRRSAGGESGFDAYRMLGNVVNPANLAAAAKLPQAASLAGRIGVGAGFGAGSGSAFTPVIDGDFWAEKGKQAGIGAVAGGVVPLIAGAASRVISPNASKNAKLALLKSEGVRPTIGQTLGGRWNALEEKMQSVPIMGDMISKARRGVNSEFETAAYNRALKPIGEELPTGLSGHDALAHTEKTLKNSYNAVLNKIGAITPDEAFTSKVASLQKMVNQLMMPKAEKAKFSAAMNDVRQSIDGNGVITSDAYKALESSLGTDAKKLAASTNIYEGKVAPAIKQLQEELRDMLKRQAGANADDLKAVNTGWANFKRVQNAAGKLGADEGDFTPAQFQSAVRTMDKSKDKAAFARGNALGQDLSDAGKSMLGNKVPNSGTADRLMYGGGALASGVLNPAIPASLIGGAAMYSRPAQSLLNMLVSSRHQAAQPIANALDQYSAALLPLGTQIGLGFNK